MNIQVGIRQIIRPIRIYLPESQRQRRIVRVHSAFTVHSSLQSRAYLAGASNLHDLPQIVIVSRKKGCHLGLTGCCADSHVPIALQRPLSPRLIHKSSNPLILHLLYHGLTAVDPWSSCCLLAQYLFKCCFPEGISLQSRNRVDLPYALISCF